MLSIFAKCAVGVPTSIMLVKHIAMCKHPDSSDQRCTDRPSSDTSVDCRRSYHIALTR
jgi:hypothetical protein